MAFIPPHCGKNNLDLCRIVAGPTFATALGYQMVTDGAGREVSKDPNKRTTNYDCNTCGRKWRQVEQGGAITVTENDHGIDVA